MGAEHLHQTKNVRKILKSCGFKRGEYRISTDFNHKTKGYDRTYVFMRRKTTPEEISSLVESGLTYIIGDDYPAFKW